MNGGKSILEVEGLTIRFGGLVAVSDVTFQQTEGEILSCMSGDGQGGGAPPADLIDDLVLDQPAESAPPRLPIAALKPLPETVPAPPPPSGFAISRPPASI